MLERKNLNFLSEQDRNHNMYIMYLSSIMFCSSFSMLYVQYFNKPSVKIQTILLKKIINQIIEGDMEVGVG